MDVTKAVKEYIANFDGGMGDVLESVIRQMGQSINDAFVAGWNAARQNTADGEKTPTNSAMNAIARITDVLDSGYTDASKLTQINIIVGQLHQ